MRVSHGHFYITMAQYFALKPQHFTEPVFFKILRLPISKVINLKASVYKGLGNKKGHP